MIVDPSDLAARFARMSQEELESIRREDLSDVARDLHEKELTRRSTPEWQQAEQLRVDEARAAEERARQAAVPSVTIAFDRFCRNASHGAPFGIFEVTEPDIELFRRMRLFGIILLIMSGWVVLGGALDQSGGVPELVSAARFVAVMSLIATVFGSVGIRKNGFGAARGLWGSEAGLQIGELKVGQSVREIDDRLISKLQVTRVAPVSLSPSFLDLHVIVELAPQFENVRSISVFSEDTSGTRTEVLSYTQGKRQWDAGNYGRRIVLVGDQSSWDLTQNISDSVFEVVEHLPHLLDRCFSTSTLRKYLEVRVVYDNSKALWFGLIGAAVSALEDWSRSKDARDILDGVMKSTDGQRSIGDLLNSGDWHVKLVK